MWLWRPVAKPRCSWTMRLLTCSRVAGSAGLWGGGKSCEGGGGGGRYKIDLVQSPTGKLWTGFDLIPMNKNVIKQNDTNRTVKNCKKNIIGGGGGVRGRDANQF